MSKLLENFSTEPQEVDNYLKELIAKYSRPASEVILDDVDLRTLLKISRRTALEYRKKEIFPSYKIENKIFYILSEVIDGIKKQKGNHEN